jgi:hypothetical protein
MRHSTEFASWLRLSMLVAGLALAQHGHAATAGVIDIDDELRATIAKEKTKQRRNEHTAGGQGGGGQQGGCGQIDIGNEQEKKGSKQVASREKTVIVTGPVINATKCR